MLSSFSTISPPVPLLYEPLGENIKYDLLCSDKECSQDLQKGAAVFSAVAKDIWMCTEILSILIHIRILLLFSLLLLAVFHFKAAWNVDTFSNGKSVFSELLILWIVHEMIFILCKVLLNSYRIISDSVCVLPLPFTHLLSHIKFVSDSHGKNRNNSNIKQT